MGIKFRNWVAVAAHFRRGGAMKHRNAPRGGASNDSRDLKDQGMKELQDEEKDRKDPAPESIPNPSEKS